MRFIECYVENFGRLQDFRYKFDGGLNTIHADNGYGKTTLTAFIKCMLYGMEDTKKQDLSENDRKHYMPWQGGRCGGSLTIEESGHIYRIERSFAPKAADDSFALYDLGTGRLSSDYSPKIGEDILGIDRDGFERTLFLSERRLSGKNDNKSISAKLSDLVGCDGDIGGVDAALKRLEDRRKYYKKTGGRGLIDEISAKISVCSSEIAALERAKESARGLESTLAEQKRELSEIEKKKQGLEAERDALRIKRSKLAIAEQYNEVLERLKRDRARLEELRVAFGGVLPSAEQIDNAVYKLREAEMLEQSVKQESGGEYAILAAKFEGKTDLSEIERTAALVGEISADEKRLAELSTERTAPSPHFSRRLPGRDELTAAKSGLRGSGVGIVLTLLLAIAAAVGAYLLQPYFAAIPIVLGIIVSIIISGTSAKRCRKAIAVLKELSDEPLPKGKKKLRAHVDMLLDELATESERIDAERAREISREQIRGDIDEKRGAIISLLSRLNAPTSDPFGEIACVRAEFLRYYGAALGERAAAEERRSAIARASALRSEVKDFLSRFTGLGDSPFDKLKEMLSEYNYLVTSTADRARECAQLKEKYGSDTEVGGFDQEKLTELEIELRDIESTLEMRRRECTAIDLRLSNEAETYERIHELRARAAALEEQKAAAEDTLDTILRTKTMLLAAMEAMTSKYLGKTREGFEKYRNLIQGESCRDFLLDTSFTLSVGDVGGTHPEEAYSRGTRDIYALATRLALSDALYEGELPPIILDDPFTALDDRALSEALGLVEKIAKTRQVIYLTCHKSRKPE